MKTLQGVEFSTTLLSFPTPGVLELSGDDPGYPQWPCLLEGLVSISPGSSHRQGQPEVGGRVSQGSSWMLLALEESPGIVSSKMVTPWGY